MMDYAHLLAQIEKAPVEKKLEFYSKVAHDLTVRTRELYKLQHPGMYYMAFNEIQHQLSGHIIKMLLEKKGYTDAQMIKMLSQGEWVDRISPATELSLEFVSKRVFK